jgi:hypothetical protein
VTSTAVPPPGPRSESIQFDALAPECIRDIPYINYAVFSTVQSTTVDLTLSDVNGIVVATHLNQPLSGTIVYPSASVDPGDWPGRRVVGARSRRCALPRGIAGHGIDQPVGHRLGDVPAGDLGVC